jgi:hypothetical protein
MSDTNSLPDRIALFEHALTAAELAKRLAVSKITIFKHAVGWKDSLLQDRLRGAILPRERRGLVASEVAVAAYFFTKSKNESLGILKLSSSVQNASWQNPAPTPFLDFVSRPKESPCQRRTGHIEILWISFSLRLAPQNNDLAGRFPNFSRCLV